MAERGSALFGERSMALALAAAAGASSVALSASAGWFLAAAALVGAAGPAAAHAFNILAPSAAIRLFALTRTLTRYTERVIGHDAVLAKSARTRPRLLRALARRQNARLELTATGDLDARLVRDVEAVDSDLVHIQAPLFAAFGAVAACAVALLFAGIQATLAVFAAFAISAYGAPALVRALSTSRAAEAAILHARLRTLSVSLQTGLPEVKSYSAETRVLQDIDDVAAAIAQAEHRLARAAAIGNALALTLFSCAILAILFATIGTKFDPAATMAAILATLALYDQTAPLNEAGVRRAAQQAAKARLNDIEVAQAAEAPIGTLSADCNVEVENFAALSDTARAMAGRVSFSAPEGRIVALVGRSGAGKTTLLRALLGFPVRASGRVLIGGVAPHERADIGALIAYAPQSADLLPGAVRENLALAAPEANEAEMWAALKAAQVSEAVMAAGGVDAQIGAAGEGFSGGESRRLALARAFISQRPILLLDEPTEGLDAETEATVIAHIAAYVHASPRRLVVLVTHRPAVLAIADLVIDFDEAERVGENAGTRLAP